MEEINYQVRKISTGQGDDYTSGWLLEFPYFEKIYRLITVDLSKQKASDTDSRAIQQITFTGKASKSVNFITFLNNQKEQY